MARRKSRLKIFNKPGQEPPHQADALGALVVAGDGDVDELGGGVHVGERHNWDVGIGGLSDGLVVAPRIIDKQCLTLILSKEAQLVLVSKQ